MVRKNHTARRSSELNQSRLAGRPEPQRCRTHRRLPLSATVSAARRGRRSGCPSVLGTASDSATDFGGSGPAPAASAAPPQLAPLLSTAPSPPLPNQALALHSPPPPLQEPAARLAFSPLALAAGPPSCLWLVASVATPTDGGRGYLDLAAVKEARRRARAPARARPVLARGR
jgi:hypothetical protein